MQLTPSTVTLSRKIIHCQTMYNAECKESPPFGLVGTLSDGEEAMRQEGKEGQQVLGQR